MAAAAGRRTGALDRLGAWSVRTHPPIVRWSVAGAALSTAAALRFLIQDILPPGFPFLTFFPAVLLTAFLAGTREGVVVAVACLLMSWYFFIPPLRSFEIHIAVAVALGLYAFVTGSEILLVHLMRRALARAQAAEARARSEARARALMFAELQHRVSNNLSVMGALLTMQRREVADPAAVRALDDAAQRLTVVARLSRLLHDPEAQAIDFGGFLHAMVPDAVATGGAEGRVRVEVEAGPVVVPAAQAIPLGLIATELIANALEHGFPDGRQGLIRVVLRATGPAAARLEVSDDGVGLPPGFDLAATRSLGLSIAREFARQVGGRLDLRAGQGVVSSLDFPLGAPGA